MVEVLLASLRTRTAIGRETITAGVTLRSAAIVPGQGNEGEPREIEKRSETPGLQKTGPQVTPVLEAPPRAMAVTEQTNGVTRNAKTSDEHRLTELTNFHG